MAKLASLRDSNFIHFGIKPWRSPGTCQRGPSAGNSAITHQGGAAYRVVAQAEFWKGFEREGKGNAVIARARLVVEFPECQRSGPTPEIAIDTVALFGQDAGAGVKIVRDAGAPI